jgi:hypothetical protein
MNPSSPEKNRTKSTKSGKSPDETVKSGRNRQIRKKVRTKSGKKSGRNPEKPKPPDQLSTCKRNLLINCKCSL